MFTSEFFEWPTANQVFVQDVEHNVVVLAAEEVHLLRRDEGVHAQPLPVPVAVTAPPQLVHGNHTGNRRTFFVRHILTRKEGNVLFNDALNTFYLRLYGIRHMVKDHSDSEKGNPLPPHRLLFTITNKGYFICTIPQTGQDRTYHSICYTSRGTLAGRKNSSMGSPHEGSIRQHHERTPLPWSYISLPSYWQGQMITISSKI